MAQHPRTGLASISVALLGGLLASTSLLGAAWAQPAVLEQVDVISSRYGTELKLHADQPIQHRVLQATDTHLILELSGVTTPRSVRTNFAQAQDVRHVIFQPNGHERLQVNIRGQQLGQPMVQVVYPTANNSRYGKSSGMFGGLGASPAIAAPAQPMATAAIESPKVTPAPADANPVLQPAKPALSNGLPKTDGPVSLSGINPAIAANTAPKAMPLPAPEPAKSSRSSLDADPFAGDAMMDDAHQPIAEETPGLFTLMIGELGQLNLGLVGGIAGVVILMIGLGVFIRYRWQQLANQAEGDNFSQNQSIVYDDRQDARQKSSRSPFGNMARQQGGRHNDSIDRDDNYNGSFRGSQHPTKANPFAARPKTQLHQPVKHAPQPMQKMMAIPPARKAASSASPALKQYQQAAKAPAKAAPMAKNDVQPMAFERISRQEAMSPMAAPKQDVAKLKQHASLPRPSAGDPLPTNPHVLNFLKDVASYMEQDGDKHRARQITKSLKKFS